MRVFAVIVLAVCLLTALGGVGPAVSPVTADTQNGETDDGVAADAIDIDVRLESDGDANVSVYKKFAITGETDRKAFEQLAEDFESTETDDMEDAFSLQVFKRIAAGASEDTGREMTIEDDTRETEIDDERGILELRFQWTNFANVTDDRMEVGDVFEVDGHTWLSSLPDNQRLIIRTPEDYAIDDTADGASINDGVLIWEGPHEFESGGPNAILVQRSQSTEDFSVLTVGLGLALVVAIILLVYLASQRRATPLWGRDQATEGRGWTGLLPPTAGDGGEERSPPHTRSDTGTEPAIERRSEPDESDDPFDGVDEELLSDEERVVRLLEANEGRMKQANIVVETNWSNAKVSQLLSSMADEGRIEKLRIGRENLITLIEDTDENENESEH